MQNHLDASQRSFAMLGSGDPFGPPPGHEHYATLTNHNHSSPPGADFGHLLSANGGSGGGGGGGNPPMVNSNHHNHAHHNHSSNNTSNNNNSPSNNNNNNNNNAETKPKKTLPPNGKKTKGRVKIKMEFIDNKLRRYTTFSKRKTGIMKKAYELSTLTGTQVMLLVASETGHVYTFATRKLQPMITSEAGKALIQTCLNSPDPPGSGTDPQRMSATGYEETELTYAADPNASDHGDTKDGESESGSSDGEDQKEVPPLLPLSSNGLLPPNFAALIASATGMGGSKGPFSLDLTSQISAAAAAAAAAAAVSSSSSSFSSSTSSPSSSAGSSSSQNHPHHQHHHHHHHHQSSSSPSLSNNSQSSSNQQQQELLLLQQTQLHHQLQEQQAQLQKQIQMQQQNHTSSAKVRVKREAK